MKLELIKILIIARYTFIEIYKSRIFFNILLAGIALVMVSFIASEFSYGVQARIALDFGIGSMYLIVIGISIFMGVNLVSYEIEQRTCYMILCRPLKRHSFILGKILGMSSMLFLNVFFLGMMSVVFFYILGGQLSSLIFWCLIFSFFEAIILLLIVVFFSLITNITMSVIYTLCVFVLGHVLSATLMTRMVEGSGILSDFIKFLLWIFPNLSKLNVKDFLIYEQSLPSDYLFKCTLYAIGYITMLLVINCFVFNHKELD